MTTANRINGHDYARPPVEQFGYTGGARWIVFWWESSADELAWSDSRGFSAVGLGNGRAFLDWPGRELWPAGAFGASDAEASAAIVWDRKNNHVAIYEAGKAAAFIHAMADAWRAGRGE